jgi:hypothetical protein
MNFFMSTVWLLKIIRKQSQFARSYGGNAPCLPVASLAWPWHPSPFPDTSNLKYAAKHNFIINWNLSHVSEIAFFCVGVVALKQFSTIKCFGISHQHMHWHSLHEGVRRVGLISVPTQASPSIDSGHLAYF